MPESSPSFLSLRQKKLIFNSILGLIFLSMFVWVLIQVRVLAILFIASVLIFYIVDPIIAYLQSVFRIRRTVAILILYSSCALIIGLGLYYWLPIMADQFRALNTLLGSEEARRELIDRAEQVLHQQFSFLQAQNLTGWVNSLASVVVSSMAGFLLSLLSILSSLVIVPFILFFLLKDGRQMKKFLISKVPNRFFEMSLNLIDKIDQHLGSYIRGQMLVAFSVGSLSVFALWILGVPYFFVVGMVAGLANLIPYLGPVVGAIPAMVISILMFDSLSPLWSSGYGAFWGPLVGVAIAFSLIQLIDNVAISPLIVSKSTDLHPLVVIMVVLIGGQLFGLLGMLVAIPVVSIIKVLTQDVIWHFKNYKLI